MQLFVTATRLRADGTVSTASVDGLSIKYELLGEPGGGVPFVVIPGGRVPMDGVGIRELAAALADRGHQALIWDRPNTGASDVCFTGPTEAAMHSDVLAGLLEELGLARAVMCGGSAGARLSLVTAIRHPEVTAGLGLWWVSGGVYAMFFLGMLYHAASIDAVWNGGMQAVAALPEWQDVINRNPGNRQRFLDQDPLEFRRTLLRWMEAFIPVDRLAAGITEEDARQLDVPVLIFRNGVSDMNHTRTTSDRLAELVPRARVVDPPWPDSEWIDRRVRGSNVFINWPKLAPQLHEWAAEVLPP